MWLTPPFQAVNTASRASFAGRVRGQGSAAAGSVRGCGTTAA